MRDMETRSIRDEEDMELRGWGEQRHYEGGISEYQKIRRQVSRISEYQELNLMLCLLVPWALILLR
jgi:hypothetical protein